MFFSFCENNMTKKWENKKFKYNILFKVNSEPNWLGIEKKEGAYSIKNNNRLCSEDNITFIYGIQSCFVEENSR